MDIQTQGRAVYSPYHESQSSLMARLMNYEGIIRTDRPERCQSACQSKSVFAEEAQCARISERSLVTNRRPC